MVLVFVGSVVWMKPVLCGFEGNKLPLPATNSFVFVL